MHTRRRKVGRVGGATAREREQEGGERERERSNELHVERLGETLGRQLCPAALFFSCVYLWKRSAEKALMGGEGEDPAACAREDAHVCPITTRHRLGSFFFSQPPGIRRVLSLAPESLSSGVFFRLRSKQLPPSPPQDTSPCAHLHPPPSPPQVHGFKNSEESPPRTATWLTCRFLRETAVPSSCRKTLPTETKGVELENATTDTEAGASLVGRRPRKTSSALANFFQRGQKGRLSCKVRLINVFR